MSLSANRALVLQQLAFSFYAGRGTQTDKQTKKQTNKGHLFTFVL